tara:strand:+ start:5171 stop:5449 length:279 start_codon:yes stop_codon:yes gene_type:complete
MNLPGMFTYSHKAGDDLVFCSDKGKLVTNPQVNNVCFFAGKEYVFYQAKRKDGMLELHMQYSMLEPDFDTIPDPFALVMFKGSPEGLFDIIE